MDLARIVLFVGNGCILKIKMSFSTSLLSKENLIGLFGRSIDEFPLTPSIGR